MTTQRVLSGVVLVVGLLLLLVGVSTGSLEDPVAANQVRPAEYAAASTWYMLLGILALLGGAALTLFEGQRGL